MAAAAQDQIRNAQIREWAAENGFEIGDRGRLPAGVVAAYEAATAGDDDGPDWQAAGAALGVVPGTGAELADNEHFALRHHDRLVSDDDTDLAGPAPAAMSPDQATSSGGAGQPAQAAPPVTSLADARARMQSAPKRPGWAGKERAQRAASPRGGKARQQPARPVIEITPAVLGDMEGKLAMLLAIPVSGWELVDPYCGGAMAQQLPETIPPLVKILARSPAVVRLMTGDDAWIALVALAVALRPVAVAVYEHHFSQDARQAKRAAATGEAQQAADDLSAYSASPVVTGHVPAYRAG